MPTDPTRSTYEGLTEAYDFFNNRLFADDLPRCLVTLQRHRKYFGYFAGKRFVSHDGTEFTDEIALNPTPWKERTVEASLSTLVHEMCHLKQHHRGKPSRGAYHNKQWAAYMHEVGLIPSDTGAPGGKETGQSMTHYIEEGGRFAKATAELVGSMGFKLRYVELWGDEDARAKKRASKTKYTCDSCGQNAWSKPDSNLICGDCNEVMEELVQ